MPLLLPIVLHVSHPPSCRHHPPQVPYYERAIAIDPAFTAARHNLASAYHSLKLHDKAAGLFEGIIAEQPENFEATISLAHVYRDLGRNERARDMLAASHP